MATATAIAGGTRPNAIFASVFAPKTFTIPTPEATPNIGTLASPGPAFGGFQPPSSPTEDAVRFNRVWSTVTRFLSLTQGIVTTPKKLREDPAANEAIQFLLAGASTQKELLAWYLNEVGSHFRLHVLPELAFWHQPVSVAGAIDALARSVEILGRAQSLYFSTFEARRRKPSQEDVRLRAFDVQLREDFHTLVLHALPRSRIQKTLSSFLYHSMESALETGGNPEKCVALGRCVCQLGLDIRQLSELSDVGFGGNLGERAFAFAIHQLLQGPAVNRPCFRVDWSGAKSLMNNVRNWVNEQLAPAVQAAINAVAGGTTAKLPPSQLMSITVNSFGRSRIDALLDYVKAWPASRGAVSDIKEYLNENGPAEKAQLCATFSDQMKRRILHAGASTSEILGVYMNIISVFHILDARRVLFEKVSVPVRHYLRSRDDTVSIVAASFLVDVEDDRTHMDVDPEKVCLDLAVEIAKSDVHSQVTKTLNFDDMAWMPEPLDAVSDLKSSKHDDIVASILGLFDPDDFTQAFHTALGHHLLQTKNLELIKETKLVEILKDRLDSSRLQSFEVMLKDMRDSAALNKRAQPGRELQKATPQAVQAAIPSDGITLNALYQLFEDRMSRAQFAAVVPLVARRRGDLYFPKRARVSTDMPEKETTQPEDTTTTQVNVKMMSRHYWPTKRKITQDTPPQIKQALEIHEQKFSVVSGGQRRIDWDHGSGHMRVLLELDDRTIEENDVETHKAVVIDAFALERQSDSDTAPTQYDPLLGLGVLELVNSLNMPEDRILDALNFWVSKRVLYQITLGRYAVLERLDMDIEPVQDAMDAPQVQSLSVQDTMLREQAPLYQAFIVNMLRNTGPKQIDGMMGVTAVLKMMMQDFPYGDDEVKWLLAEMLGRGEVKRDGEVWSAV